MISREAVKEIAALARLDLSGEELDRLASDLGRITSYIDTLVDAGVLDQASGPVVSVPADRLRADESRPSVRPEVALTNAPSAEAGYFKLPKIVE